MVQVLEHNYPLYILIWLGVSLTALFIFRVIPKKMKQIDDKQTKNSLFTIMIFFGLPLMLASVVAPLVFIIGDKNMEPLYRYGWIGLISVFLIYFFIKQKSRGGA
jgi:uncharacterized membrane protein